MESVINNYPYWKMRTFGGALFLVGMVVFAYNIIMTVAKADKSAETNGTPVVATGGR
jgi:cbb3-type cytochrome oxidase subunit 1